VYDNVKSFVRDVLLAYCMVISRLRLKFLGIKTQILKQILNVWSYEYRHSPAYSVKKKKKEKVPYFSIDNAHPKLF